MKKLFKSLIVALSLGVTSLVGTLAPAMAYTPMETYAATTKKESTYSITPSVTLKKGEEKTVNVSFNDNGTGNVYTVAWGYNPTYYNFKANGYGSYWGQSGKCTITGKKAGNKTVTAYLKIFKSKTDKTVVKHVTLKCNVNITNETFKPTANNIPIQSIALNKTSGTLTVGQSVNLSVSIKPANTTADKSIKWASNNGSVATVTNGKVTAKKAGVANIYATVGSRTVKYTLIVKPAAVQKITLNKTSETLKVGESKTLSIKYTPQESAGNGTVKWTSSNSAVASVSNGKITAKKAGTANITATYNGKSSTCKVTVKANSSNTTTNKTTNTTTNTTTNKATNTATNTTTSTGYVDVSEAYTLLNNFRTKKSVWQWNTDNKTKTYFNTTSSNTLKAISRNTKLEATAKVRAKELATKYSHYRPDGSKCFTAYPACSAMGENIAMGYTSASAVTTGWIEENEKYGGQGHRRNMLNSSFNAVGIACYKANGRLYWVQCFKWFLER